MTEDIVTAYLGAKPNFKDVTICVRELPTAADQNKCFVVSAPFSKKRELYDMNLWPRGVGVKRFDFSRRRGLEEVESI